MTQIYNMATHVEITLLKICLNLGNGCWHSVKNLLFPSALQNGKIEIHKTVSLPVLDWCKSLR